MNTKTYLGDGVYVEYDNYEQVVLMTDNGIETTNTIYLEPAVLAALLEYLKRAVTYKVCGRLTSSWLVTSGPCPGCGAEIVVGVGNQPIAEHYEPDFSLKAVGSLLNVYDC